MKPKQPTEHQEQAALIAWWSTYAKTKQLDPRLLFAIPQAAKRSYALASYMKAEGLRAGVPDLMLAIPRTGTIYNKGVIPIMLFAGLFIELKRIGGKPTPDQLAYADLLRRQGFSVVIAYGFEESRRAITGYLQS